MIEVVEQTGSTNEDLAARLRGGERVAEGHWLIADRQVAGKGRQGREWFDGTGNFMGSTLVRLAPGDPAPASLSLVAGLALYEAVLPLIAGRAELQLKWPNDLLLAGGKLSGILLERVGDAVIVGIGVNLKQAPHLEDRRTTALSAFGPAPERDDFAAALRDAFALEISRWRQSGVEPIVRRWSAAAHPIGTPITVHEPGGERLTGEFGGLAHDGSLRLRLADGAMRVIHAGDVLLPGEA